MGIPVGLLVDGRGPRWGTTMGAICMICGYFPLWSAYNKGANQSSFLLLCLASFLTGAGSCSCFSGAIKVCATNWPQHRGTATALPLSAFGLSAFAYTSVGGAIFPHDAGHLLLFLAIGTTTTICTGMIFLRMLPPDAPYKPLAGGESSPRMRRDSNPLHRTNSRQSKHSRGPSVHEQGMLSDSITRSPFQHIPLTGNVQSNLEETSSLLSNSTGPLDQPDTLPDHHLHKPDITGWALLKSGAFWKLWILLGLLCGVGLMTIK